MKFRKMTAVLAACILAVSANIGLPEAAYSGTSLQAAASETATGTYGNLTYVSTGSAITITQCDANATYEVIPEEIDGLPVTKIDSNAFENCTKLVGVIVPESVKNIGLYAFSGCTALSDVTLPESVTAISAHMFAGCTALESLTLPSGTISIGYNAFDGCTALSDITLPDTVTTIGSAAFTGCTSLTEMAIPDAVLSVGDSAFEGCTALETVKLGSAIKVLGGLAFADCTALTAINIPASVTTIGDGVFRNSLAMTSLTVNSANTKYKAVENVLFSADMTQLIAYPAGRANLYYTVPKTVTDIHDYAFYGNLHLTEITFPNTLATIGANAFYSDEGVTNIEKVFWYDTLEPGTDEGYQKLCQTVETYANLQEGEIYGNCIGYYTGIYYDADQKRQTFSNRIYLKEYDSGTYRYMDYDNSSYVIYDSDNNEGTRPVYQGELYWVDPAIMYCDCMGNKILFAFEYNSEYNDYVLVKAVNPETYEDGGVYYYKGYYSINEYGSVKELKVSDVEKAYSVDKMSEIVAVSENNIFGSDACLFRYSFGLDTTPNETDALSYESFTYHQYDSSVGICGYDTSLTTAVLPDKIDRLPVTAIEDMAFYRCNDLQSVTISDNVATIGEYAFYFNSELETVVIPYSVSAIDASAFAGCTDLKDVYYNGSEEEWAAITVGTNNECLLNATIHFNSTGPEPTTEPTTEPESYILGDVNLDDKVSVADVISVNKFYMKTGDLTELQQTAGDCNHDGSVDLSDSLMILKSLIGLVTLS